MKPATERLKDLVGEEEALNILEMIRNAKDHKPVNEENKCLDIT